MKEDETEETADGTSGTAQKEKEKEEMTGKVRVEGRWDGTTETRGPGGISVDTIHITRRAATGRGNEMIDGDEDERERLCRPGEPNQENPTFDEMNHHKTLENEARTGVNLT